MNLKILWSIALGIGLVLFALNHFRKNKTTKSSIASGFILWQTFDNWFDFVIYPATLLFCGIVWGFVAMFVVTLLCNASYILVNNATSFDWTLMSQTLKLPIVRNVVSWKIGRFNVGKAIGFILLSIKFDSFYATNFLFGKGADLRKVKVLIPFLVSHAICNLAWTSLWGVVFVSFKTLMKTLPLS